MRDRPGGEMLGQAVLKQTSADSLVNNEKKVSLKSDLEKKRRACVGSKTDPGSLNMGDNIEW